ncbi:MAG: hypothetical protein M1834_009112 [Cirrosporium novae-zelandiae]|nr:MAG: hypothetical protein M1834_009112 [Cirrosporium novae-zelandiae]
MENDKSVHFLQQIISQLQERNTNLENELREHKINILRQIQQAKGNLSELDKMESDIKDSLDVLTQKDALLQSRDKEIAHLKVGSFHISLKGRLPLLTVKKECMKAQELEHEKHVKELQSKIEELIYTTKAKSRQTRMLYLTVSNSKEYTIWSHIKVLVTKQEELTDSRRTQRPGDNRPISCRMA